MSINIMIAFSNMLFSKGVEKILEGQDDIKVSGVLKSDESPDEMLKTSKPDVILVDFNTLYNMFELSPKHGRNFILFDTCCGEENIVSAVINKGLKGVLGSNSTPELLKKAIRAVAEGEIWLDKANVKNLLTGLHAIKKNTRPDLSEREQEIVSLVGQGYRNKEIAERLSISEPTVKTHMQRIFQKLDIQNRPQLITFALKKSNGPSMYNAVFLQ